MEYPISISSISSELERAANNSLRIKKALADAKKEVNRLETEQLNNRIRIEELKKSMDKILGEVMS